MRATGCNKLVVNSDYMQVVDRMMATGHPEIVAAALHEDCYLLMIDLKLTFRALSNKPVQQPVS
jgi:hypothetical protein